MARINCKKYHWNKNKYNVIPQANEMGLQTGGNLNKPTFNYGNKNCKNTIGFL